MTIVAAALLILACAIGVLLTALTLPGIWMMTLCAALLTWWRPDLMPVWVIIASAGIAILGEVAEFLSSAAGSGKAGGTKHAAWGSIVGSIIGLILGTVFLAFLPIIGSIIGGIIGAGLGALIADRAIAKRTWSESARAGRGAAVGRALATVIKTAFALAAALTLTVGALWPA